MSEFYNQTGGLALMVIKHHGPYYSYVRKPGELHNYRDSWNVFLPMMRKEMCYIVASTHQVGRSAMTQIGIVDEMNEQDARNFNKEYFESVMNGQWDAAEQWPEVKRLILEFHTNHINKKLKEAELRLKL
jgi:hypothetical protein